MLLLINSKVQDFGATSHFAHTVIQPWKFEMKHFNTN